MIYSAYRYSGLDCARRYAALTRAFELLNEYCHEIDTPSGLATLVRVALDLGYRGAAVDILQDLVSTGGVEIDQPFYPPCERYEHLTPAGRESEWFVAAASEQFELMRSYSSYFHRDDEIGRLKWLCESPFSSAEINRRLILAGVRQGQGLLELGPYLNQVHPHKNPSYWTTSGLPGIL